MVVIKYQISETNPMLQAYQRYLAISYSSPKTRYLYEKRAINFLNSIFKKTKQEPVVLTQNILDDYVIQLNSKKTTNPACRAFIKSFRLCFDKEEKIFYLNTKLDRSRQRVKLEVYDWLDKESIDKLVEKGSPYISLMTQLYFETARRLTELTNCDLENKEWGLDLVNRTLTGIGKGNKEFRAHFSEKMAQRIYEWIKSPLCKNKVKPFLIYKANGQPCSNQGSALDYRLKQECAALGIKDVHGKNVHTHAFKHSIGRYLSDKGWNIQSIAVKLSHSNLNNTKKYSSPDIEQIEQKEDEEVFNAS